MQEEIKEILEELENMYEISELEEQVNNIKKIKDYITNLQEDIKSVIWQLQHNIRPQALQRDKYIIEQLNNSLKGNK